MDATVSIAMCSFNGARFIGAQLASLAAQTLQPVEVVICDDGSTDQTPEIVAEFARTAPFPVHFHRNAERQGYRRNFMQAAGLCRGDLVAFCDQDDLWRADKLQKVAAAFADPTVIVVHHNARLVDAEGAPIGRINTDKPTSTTPALQASPWLYSLGFTQTFRRELNRFGDLRQSILGEQERGCTAHDQWISFLGQALGSSTYLSDELVDYRQHGANTYGFRHDKRGLMLVRRIKRRWNYYLNNSLYQVLCERRVEILRIIGERAQAGSALHRSAADAIPYYERLARFYRHRAEIYSARGWAARFRAWRSLTRESGYDGSAFPFLDRKSWARDLLHGVLIGGKAGEPI